MTLSPAKWPWPALVMAFLAGGHSLAAEIEVDSQQAYFDAVRSLQPGDTIVLANGEWRDFEILFAGNGTAERPITLTAETKGKVIITGQSNLRIAGEHLIVSGLVFKDGYSPTNTVIAFRRTKGEYARNSRVTEVVVDHFSNPERHETDFWVIMYGRNNRFDHNHLVGKSNSGVTMAVRLDSEESQNNHHRIDHNYFGPRPVLGSNGGETLRIGTSKYSLTDSFTVVENNYFDRCNGEVEIISSKSGNNTFRGNVFFESRGTLTLRHGNDNLVENNVFLGNGVDHTGGIRLINKRQTIRNNYLSGLTGHRFGGGLVIMNGVPNSPINRYHQVEDSVVENNTLVNVEHIELAAGSDEERSAVPITTTFRNNIIMNDAPKDSIAVHDDVSGIAFEGNIVSNVDTSELGDGFEHVDSPLDRTDAGAPRKLQVLERDAVGVSWYAKPGYGSRFDTGKTTVIQPGSESLAAAVAASSPGDVIELLPGNYVAARILAVAHPLTIRGRTTDSEPVTLGFERSALFEILDGGSLRLQNLAVDGSSAPDAYGNAVVRTSRYSMLTNYRLEVDSVEVRNLNTNHSFNFLKIAGSTFADDISIRASSFENITGHVISLAREIDDLGIYNAEYINIADSTFRNIQGSLATVYRGGTDESTFGPHFLLANSTLDNVGHGKRNKSGASVFLHGVQVASIRDNRFNASRPIEVETTVGEPRTTIDDNQFIDTPEPLIAAFVRR